MTENEESYVDILEGLDTFEPTKHDIKKVPALALAAMYVDDLSSKINLDHVIDDRPQSLIEFDSFGRTALHWVAGHNYAAGCCMLIDKFADKNAKTEKEGFTPLMIACRKGGSAKLAQALLKEQEADFSARAKSSATAFHIAVASGSRNCMRLLILHGANPFLTLDDGRSALDFAEDEEMKSLVYSCQRSAILYREKLSKRCAECGVNKFVLRRCGKCYAAYYCGRDCQVEDWKKKHCVNCSGSIIASVINDSAKSKQKVNFREEKEKEKFFVVCLTNHPDDGHVVVESEEKSLRAKIDAKLKKLLISSLPSYHWAKFTDSRKKELFVYFAYTLPKPSSQQPPTDFTYQFRL